MSIAPLLADYAAGELSATEASRIAAHLPQCAACTQHVQQLRMLLGQLADLPVLVPPLAVRDNFLAALAHEQAAQAATAPLPSQAQHPEARVVLLWAPTLAGQWLRVAASVALLAVGALLGMLLNQQRLSPAGLSSAASELSTQLAATAAQPASASYRLRLVQQTPASLPPGDPAVQILVTTLNADPSPNVRLAAAEALYRLRADPRVAPALVQALPNQTDPNVQITLIELLVALRDRRAVLPLERLARQPDALPAVRQQASQGLGLLI
ncbi:HEAT repeat domain-containing protein [Hymenobacter puniceus]|uniref:HEAT repeat domain-containing protein n=1 Tax=Hymenobacter sp. BT190 TaxID=2763505 RepID=UPI001651027C|nr:HEAT repeat domain-containing protein [Hymenobacter sp. BT190]